MLPRTDTARTPSCCSLLRLRRGEVGTGGGSDPATIRSVKRQHSSIGLVVVVVGGGGVAQAIKEGGGVERTRGRENTRDCSSSLSERRPEKNTKSPAPSAATPTHPTTLPQLSTTTTASSNNNTLSNPTACIPPHGPQCAPPHPPARDAAQRTPLPPLLPLPSLSPLVATHPLTKYP